MPYKSVSDLPDSVKEKYNKREQKAFLETFNSAYDEYNGDEGRAFSTAYTSANNVKKKRKGRKKASKLAEFLENISDEE